MNRQPHREISLRINVSDLSLGHTYHYRQRHHFCQRIAAQDCIKIIFKRKKNNDFDSKHEEALGYIDGSCSVRKVKKTLKNSNVKSKDELILYSPLYMLFGTFDCTFEFDFELLKQNSDKIAIRF